MSGPIENRVREKIVSFFSPVFIELENESHMHSVPVNSETHFRLIVVSEKFQGLTRIARQRLVNEVLKEEMKAGGIHALTQKTLTPEEWQSQAATLQFESPPCHGGSKASR